MKKEFDVYICDGQTEHRTLIERKPTWGNTAMEAIACPICKLVAGYEGFIEVDMPLSYSKSSVEPKSTEKSQ